MAPRVRSIFWLYGEESSAAILIEFRESARVVPQQV